MPASTYDKDLPIRISLAEPFEGIPVLETAACHNVEIENLEDIYIC